MDFTGPTDFIVAGMPGQTWAGPPGHFVAGPPGEVVIGEPAHVPIHIDPIVRPPMHDTSAPIPQPMPAPSRQGPWTPPQAPARAPVEYPAVGVAVGAANRAESAAAVVMGVGGGTVAASGGVSGAGTGAGSGGSAGGASGGGASGGSGSAVGASPAVGEAASLSRGGSGGVSAPGASPAAMEAASLSRSTVGGGAGTGGEPAAATGSAPVQGAGGGAPMMLNQPSYSVAHNTAQSVDVFPSVSVAQGAVHNVNNSVSELSNFDHDTANVLAPMNTVIRQGDISVRFGSPFVHKHTGPTSVHVQSGSKDFVTYDSVLNTNFGLDQYYFSFDQTLLQRTPMKDINRPVDFSDLEVDPMDFSESRVRLDQDAFRQVRVNLEDLRAELDQDLFKPATVELEDLAARIEFGPYSPAEVDFSEMERPIVDFSDVQVDRVEDAQPRSSLIQVQIDDAGRTSVDFGSPSIPEEGSGRIVSFLS